MGVTIGIVNIRYHSRIDTEYFWIQVSKYRSIEVSSTLVSVSPISNTQLFCLEQVVRVSRRVVPVFVIVFSLGQSLFYLLELVPVVVTFLSLCTQFIVQQFGICECAHFILLICIFICMCCVYPCIKRSEIELQLFLMACSCIHSHTHSHTHSLRPTAKTYVAKALVYFT